MPCDSLLLNRKSIEKKCIKCILHSILRLDNLNLPPKFDLQISTLLSSVPCTIWQHCIQAFYYTNIGENLLLQILFVQKFFCNYTI